MARSFPVPALGAALITALIAAAAAAQSVDGLDVAAARARAKAMTPDAERFVDTIRRRGDALRTDADATAKAAMANKARVGQVSVPGRASTTGVDFDQLVASASSIDKAKLAQAPKFIAFASTSMPVDSMRAMIRDVGRAGGVVVFQGFRGNSVKQHMAYLQQVIAKGQKVDGLGIDPRLFRAFGVRTVPAYVVVSTDFELCSGFRCATPLPAYDRMSGNVTPEYALSTIAGGGGPGAAVARAYLTRLRSAGSRP